MRRLTDDPVAAARFEALVREAESIFEALAPDPRLADQLDRYGAVVELWAVWMRGTRRDRRGQDELRHKTRRMVQESIGLRRIRDELPAATLDVSFLSALKKGPEDLTTEERVTEIEAAVEHEITVRGEDDPLAKTLAERLQLLRAKHEREAQVTIELLAEWEGIVRRHVEEQSQADQLGLAAAGAVALAVLRRADLDVVDQVLVDAARELAADYESIAGFDGWSHRSDVVKGLRKAVIRRLAGRPETRPLTLEPEVIDELLAGLLTLDRS
ncbi:MAG: hypothetical protein JSS68_02370 [Actinobacteria bacterium]|nr:hypothetical protein [Actinomycetota bacterium]